MSEQYARDRTLVRDDSDYYDRALDTTISLSIVGFLLGMLTLVNVVGLTTSGGALGDVFLGLLAVGVGGVGFVGVLSYSGVVPVTSRRLRGIGFGLLVALVGMTVVSVPLEISMGTLLGVVLLVQSGTVVATGIASRLDLVDTIPNDTAGVLAGASFAVCGFFVGLAISEALFGLSSPVWLALSLGLAAGMFLLVVLPREDVGTTVPVGLVVGLLGATTVLGVVGPGWQWVPESIDGGLTGGVVVPFFVLVGSVLSGWAAAKGRAGFGARGRQYGAFLIVTLNAGLMILVMVSLVAFVVINGASYAFHGFRMGAVSLMVLLSPLLVVTVQWARTPAGTDDWASAARQLFRVLPVAVVGSVLGGLGWLLVTGSSFGIPVTYTADRPAPVGLTTNQARIALTPETTVGVLMLLVPALLIFTYFFRRYGSLSNVGSPLPHGERIGATLGLVVGGGALLSGLLFVLGPNPFGLPVGGTVGLALVWAGALGAAGLVGTAAGSLLVGDGDLPERAHLHAQFVKVGVFGGLGVLLAVVLVELTAVVNPRLGPLDLGLAVAGFGLVSSLVIATIAAIARRRASTGIRPRILAEEVRLGLAGAAGFVALLAMHVGATGVPFNAGPLTIDAVGSFEWPMVLAAEISLGPQPGGIVPAVVGTIWLIIGAATFAVPLGVGAAIFLTEYAEQGKFTGLVEVATNALWSTPSVVFGLFGATFLIPRIGGDESLMSAMLVLGFMLLPLVLITSRESIKSVPDEYRDASAALGVKQWETIRSVVVPAAVPGVITGVVLGVGRIAGETAPLILVLGVGSSGSAVDVLGGFKFVAEPPFVVNDALLSASQALPKQVWAIIAGGVGGTASKGWATALILLTVVLSFYAVGILMRTYFRRKLNYE
jgi:phosphate transport system permease protein